MHIIKLINFISVVLIAFIASYTMVARVKAQLYIRAKPDYITLSTVTSQYNYYLQKKSWQTCMQKVGILN